MFFSHSSCPAGWRLYNKRILNRTASCQTPASWRGTQVHISHGLIKGTASRDFLLQVFFMIIFPQPPTITLGPFQIFSKIRGNTGKWRCTTGINDKDLELRICPRIFEKIRNGPNGILKGLGKLIQRKTFSRKSRGTVPLTIQTQNHLWAFLKNRPEGKFSDIDLPF